MIIMHENQMTILPISECSLELITDSTGWTKVYFISSDIRKHIGADTIEIIQNRLIENLCHPNSASAGKINGQEVFWVISLSEEHYTLYASKITEGWQVYLQGPDGKIYWSGLLSKNQHDLWVNILNSCCTRTA
jgi:hypothetical protein